MKVFILQGQGFGVDEETFYNLGVYSTKAKLKKALKELEEEWNLNGLYDAVTKVEEITVDKVYL